MEEGRGLDKETPVEGVFEEFTWAETWKMIDEVMDEQKDEKAEQIHHGYACSGACSSGLARSSRACYCLGRS
jgi:hypothetical protein